MQYEYFCPFMYFVKNTRIGTFFIDKKLELVISFCMLTIDSSLADKNKEIVKFVEL